jgi:hypothetical protein
MSTDRERIAELLEDETRSFRSIGRELHVSDWLVRKTARELYGDPRPMKQRRSRSGEPPPEEISPLIGWLVFGGVIGCFALAVWAGARWMPPPESPESSNSSPHPSD